MISFDTIIKSLGLFYHGQSILWVEKYSRIWRYRFGNGAVFRLIALIFHSEFFFFFFRQYLIYVRISLTYKKGSYWYWQCWFRKVRAGGTPSASRKLQHLWFNPNRYIERTTRECWTNFFFFSIPVASFAMVKLNNVKLLYSVLLFHSFNGLE